jgi:hypothetical protein
MLFAGSGWLKRIFLRNRANAKATKEKSSPKVRRRHITTTFFEMP